MTLYLKLRNNISLEGDIQLAKREVEHLKELLAEKERLIQVLMKK